MMPRGEAPEWTDQPGDWFQARAGDTVPGQVLPEGPAGPSPGRPGRPSRPGRVGYPWRPRRRWATVLRRTLATLGLLVVLGAVGFGGLLVVTPSVGDARMLAQEQDSAHGVPYPGASVPAKFAAALVATEDHRFYSDPGIDPIAVFRVAWGYLRGNGAQQGGATITQQLAKMLYTPGQSSLKAEAEQVAVAVKLNFSYTKAQILQMYADVAYYGQNYYSLGAASCGYFGVPPSRLSWSQAALMAGIVQDPSGYDPVTNPVQAHAREAHVLSRLVATGALTQAHASAALAKSLHVVPRDQALSAPANGSATCG
jgi:membrane carboxypeptidase/penicillin-binding protein PbpC